MHFVVLVAGLVAAAAEAGAENKYASAVDSAVNSLRLLPKLLPMLLPQAAPLQVGKALRSSAIPRAPAARSSGARTVPEVVGSVPPAEDLLREEIGGTRQLRGSALAFDKTRQELQQLLDGGPSEGKTLVRHHPTDTSVTRIVLTGGPCAGKSSAMEHLAKAAEREGYDLYTAPEAATLLFGAGCSAEGVDAEGLFRIQEGIMRTQLALERSLTTIAESTGRPSILVYDRGICDGKGYVPKETWERMLRSIDSTHDGDDTRGVSEEYVLGRYDGVVHLTTAADGAERFYKHGATTDDTGKAVYRRESAEEATVMDRKMREVWAAHPRHVIVECSPTFEEKLEQATDAVLSIARDVQKGKAREGGLE